MRIGFLGDIVGKAGRVAVLEALPRLRRDLALDLVVVNCENAAHGFGVTAAIVKDLLEAGADCLTTGNHVWDQREIVGAIDDLALLLRPANYPEGTPGRGTALVRSADGRYQVLVLQLMGRLFMDPLDDPFAAVDRILSDVAMPRDVDAILVDFHAEATSEKMAFGHYLDGRVSLVVGTHTHVPTADHQILPGGTAYQTDAGMCGDYDSVIGMKKGNAVERFVRKMPTDRLQPAESRATICGLAVETDPATGLARSVESIRIGGRLSRAWPGTAERRAAE